MEETETALQGQAANCGFVQEMNHTINASALLVELTVVPCKK